MRALSSKSWGGIGTPGICGTLSVNERGPDLVDLPVLRHRCAANSGCGSPMFYGGGPVKKPSYRYARSQSITSSDVMAPKLVRTVPGVDGLVAVHPLAVQPQHLGQRVGPGHAPFLQRLHRRHLPRRAVAPGLGAALDHAEVPVAHVARDTPSDADPRRPSAAAGAAPTRRASPRQGRASTAAPPCHAARPRRNYVVPQRNSSSSTVAGPLRTASAACRSRTPRWPSCPPRSARRAAPGSPPAGAACRRPRRRPAGSTARSCRCAAAVRPAAGCGRRRAPRRDPRRTVRAAATGSSGRSPRTGRRST